MEIQVLTPISHLFQDCDGSEEVLSQIKQYSDALEARERTCNLRLPKTTHYHIDFDLNIGLNDKQLSFLAEQVKPRDDIRVLTFQASKDCEKTHLDRGRYVPDSRILPLDEQVENTRLSLRQIQDIVGTGRRIGLENNNYYDTGAYDICTSESYFIRLGEISECHLLLDYAHAMVTCYNRKDSLGGYIDALLGNNECLQVHLCQPGYIRNEQEDWMFDAHELPSLDLTQKAIHLMLARNIEFLTIEYYKDADTLLKWLKWFRSSKS